MKVYFKRLNNVINTNRAHLSEIYQAEWPTSNLTTKLSKFKPNKKKFKLLLEASSSRRAIWMKMPGFRIRGGSWWVARRNFSSQSRNGTIRRPLDRDQKQENNFLPQKGSTFISNDSHQNEYLHFIPIKRTKQTTMMLRCKFALQSIRKKGSKPRAEFIWNYAIVGNAITNKHSEVSIAVLANGALQRLIITVPGLVRVWVRRISAISLYTFGFRFSL